MSLDFSFNNTGVDIHILSPEKALIGICARNEGLYLPFVLEAAQNASSDLHHTEHITVIDNGSSDRTADIAKTLGAQVINCEREGKGWAMKALFEHATRLGVNKVTVVDADLVNLDGDHLNYLTGPVLAGAPMSIGYLGGRNAFYKAVQGHWGGFSGQRCISDLIYSRLMDQDFRQARIEGACNAICRHLGINQLITKLELEDVLHVGFRQKRQDAGDPTSYAYAKAAIHYAKTYSSAARGLLTSSGT